MMVTSQPTPAWCPLFQYLLDLQTVPALWERRPAENNDYKACGTGLNCDEML